MLRYKLNGKWCLLKQLLLIRCPRFGVAEPPFSGRFGRDDFLWSALLLNFRKGNILLISDLFRI